MNQSASPLLWLMTAAAMAFLAVIVGMRRSTKRGRLDMFHPLVFPSAYVAVATLLPAMWVYGTDGSLGYVTVQSVSPRTPILLALATAGFILGAGIPFGYKGKPGPELDRNALIYLGRLLLMVPLAIALWDLRSGALYVRGEGQGTFTLEDSIGAAALVITPAATLLILTGHAHRKQLMSGIDWVLLGALVINLGLNGRRAGALAAMLVVLIYFVSRRRANFRLIFGLGAIAVFINTVLNYRSSALAQANNLSFIESALRDLGAVMFTTGHTDLRMNGFYAEGSTLIASVVRQLPSPIANNLLGPPVDTGSYRFRVLTNTSSDNGFGFSLPAEGVMNFGIVGASALPLVIGWALAWLYARQDLLGSRAIGWAYPIAVATLPFAWRADALGAVKGVAYPLLFLGVAVVCARTVWASGPAQKQRASRALPNPRG